MPQAAEIPASSALVLSDGAGVIVAAGGTVSELFGRSSSDLVGVDVTTAIGLTVGQLQACADRHDLIEATMPPPADQSLVDIITIHLDPAGMVGVVISPASSTELDRSRNLNQALTASNQQLEAFASVAAHDLQEPLRKIRAFTDRIRGMMPPETVDQVFDYLSRVDGAAERMQTLISDSLALARISGRVPAREKVDLDDIVDRVLIDLADQITETGTDVAVGMLQTMTVDPSQFRQLFTNLISNSIKYRHPDRPPRISIRSERLGSDVVITVSDNGIGFDDQYLVKIFEPFERLWGRDDYPGTGVGLALCREIVRRHDGTLGAHGRPGEGAEFVITLPVSAP